MRILIISENIGETAPGIVFERLIKGIAVDNEVTVLTSSYKPELDHGKVRKIICFPKIQIHPRLSRAFISILGYDPFDMLSAWFALRKITKQTTGNFDIVFSFLSFSHFVGMLAGRKYSSKNQAKFAVYSVDAIPPPPGWLKVDPFYKGLKKMIGRNLRHADFFFSLNRQMLEYQLKTFVPKKSLISGVIYTPGFSERKNFPLNWSGTNKFIYTGGIYGPRRPDYIIEGFNRFLKFYPASKLQFIGTQINDTLMPYKDYENIEFLPFTTDLEQYYTQATALIDIDADIENDVFLSSKMPNYLMVNRIIISETGMNSPSRHLFEGIRSIFQCDHDPDQICQAMIRAVEMRNSISFDDRNKVIRLFNIDNIMADLEKTLTLGNHSAECKLQQ